MLNSFRSLSESPVAKVLLAALVLIFALWGIEDVLRRPPGTATVATVGSQTITAGEYQRALHRETETLRRMLGDRYTPELAKSQNLPQLVLQKLVGQKLVRIESQNIGLHPSDADVVRRIRGNPNFQDTKGNFDKSIFETFLRNTGQSEKNYVEQQRSEMAAGVLLDTLLARSPMPDIAARTLLELREEQRRLTAYVLKPALVSAVSAPDAKQVQDYYDEHRREFTAPEYRRIQYVTLSDADATPKPPGDDELQAAYRERLSEFKRPERRTVDQMLFDSEEKAKKAAARLKDGVSFDTVAKDGDIVNKGATHMGKIEQGRVMENAGEAVFALRSGESTAPIQSPFGWHIFRVTAIEEPSVASFEEMRPALEKELTQRSGDEALTQLSAKLEDALAGGSTLSEAANELKLTLKEAGPLDRQGNAPDGKPAAPALDKFLDIAFKTDEGSDSALTAGQGGFYLLHVAQVTPERVRPLEEVQAKAVAGWQAGRREAKLAELSNEIAVRMTGEPAATLRQYNLKPAAEGALKRSGHTLGELSVPPELVADAFRRKPGQSTAAYKMENGDFVIASVSAVIPASSGDAKAQDARAAIRRSLDSGVQGEMLEQYTRYLSNKYKVSVNQAAMGGGDEP